MTSSKPHCGQPGRNEACRGADDRRVGRMKACDRRGNRAKKELSLTTDVEYTGAKRDRQPHADDDERDCPDQRPGEQGARRTDGSAPERFEDLSQVDGNYELQDHVGAPVPSIARPISSRLKGSSRTSP